MAVRAPGFLGRDIYPRFRLGIKARAAAVGDAGFWVGLVAGLRVIDRGGGFGKTSGGIRVAGDFFGHSRHGNGAFYPGLCGAIDLAPLEAGLLWPGGGTA